MKGAVVLDGTATGVAPAVAFDRASRVFPDGTRALNDVSLTIAPGEFCVILGPSGAGKSTLLRAVNGLVDLSAGCVRVGDTTVGSRGSRRARAEIAMIHQQFNLVPRSSVLTNVLVGVLPVVGWGRALLHCFEDRHRRVATQRLAEVGLSETHLYRRASELSGGQQQRAGIARAFMLSPRVVLADEPVASLDPRTSREILGLLRRTAGAAGSTVLCSLHQVDLAREFADRIIGMREGRVVFDGPPSELTADLAAEIYGPDAEREGGEGTRAVAGTKSDKKSPPGSWMLRPVFSAKWFGVLAVACLFLLWSGQRVEIGPMTALTAEWVKGAATGSSSQVGRGFDRLRQTLWPPQFSLVTPIDRIEGFSRDRLPWRARVESQPEKVVRLNPVTLETEQAMVVREVLVEPLGYLRLVLSKTLESIEIGVWGTLLAAVASVPLCLLASRNYSPNRVVYGFARGLISLCRAVPELISALFLVLAFGFGPPAGILALALHGAGFLAKFFAEDIENASRGPQEAMSALGLRQWRILWFAVLPEVLPQYIAYVLYVLDRNVRMATVIGLVGAGGIGQELKGRYDLFQYSHVGTILLVLFATVFVLDQISARLRARWIG